MNFQTPAGTRALMIAHQMQLRAALEKHPQHEEHVKDTINYVNAVTDHYAEVLTKNFEKTVKEEVRKALDDKEAEIKVDEKSVQSVSKTIKDLFGTIGR